MSDQSHEPQPPEVPFAGVVYGDIIYWITIVGTIITLIGSVVMFVTPNNYIDPAYLLTEIWAGKSVDEIWQGAVGSTPDGHWYLDHLFTGNGLTMAGIALGVFSVIPAILGSAYILMKDKEHIFGSLALIAAAITTYVMVA